MRPGAVSHLWRTKAAKPFCPCVTIFSVRPVTALSDEPQQADKAVIPQNSRVVGAYRASGVSRSGNVYLPDVAPAKGPRTRVSQPPEPCRHMTAPELNPSRSTLAQKVLEFLPDAMVVIDREGRISDLNPRAEQIFGYSRAELLSRPAETLVAASFRESYRVDYTRLLAEGTRSGPRPELETVGVRKDGTEFAICLSLQPLQREGEIVSFAVIRDITAKKEIEEALQRSEERFRLLVEDVKDYAIFMLDPEGRVASWNAGAQHIKGYTAEEIVGQHFSRFYAEDDIRRRKPEEELRIAASEGKLEDEGWRLRKDGSRFWADVVITAIRNPKGDLLGFAKITRDFTERKATEERLERSESRFRALFEFSPDAIVVTDHQGRITEVNTQVENMFGYSPSELAGQPVEMLIPERFRRAHPGHRIDYVERSRTRPMGAGLELRGLRKDGTEFPVDIMLSAVESGDSKMILSVVRDLSEKMRAQEELERKEREKLYLEEELNDHLFEDIVGESTALRKVLKQVETVAPTNTTVLILGETGTGKELIARAIHQLSPRNSRSLIKLNCSAIPSGLLESELFGHEKGAFTGAVAQRIGRLELADGGTLFLDEVGDLPSELQPKLLRALQEHEFERLGGSRSISVDVRLVAATNRNLEQMVANREFRSDLYYRLRVFPITLPSLRDRRADIPLLVRYFVSKHARRMSKQIESIPLEVMKALTKWDWPGNVRELENFIERSVILSKGPNLRIPLNELVDPVKTRAAEDATLESNDREHILGVLRQTKGVIAGAQGAAARLGLKRTTLNSKLKKLGIERSDYI